jgi:FSR family fosmidomycin resistance protein-like MFS transporter
MNKLKLNNIGVSIIALGHGVTDLYANFLAALLPVFANKFSLSKTSIGVIITIIGLSGSMFQVVFGYIGDKWSRRFFIIIGPTIAGIFMTLIGIAPSYFALIFILLIGGLGVSSFHPHAASTAGNVVSSKRDSSLGLFMAVGTVGYAIGPLVATSLMSSPSIGPAKMPYFSFVGIITSILLYIYVVPDKSHYQKQEIESIFRIIRPELKLLSILFAIVTFRSTTNIVFVNFMSLLIQQRQLSLMIGAVVLFIFSLSTALGTFLGGYISRWISRRNILIYSMLLSSPLLLAMLYTDGILFVIMLILSGIMISCANPANLALAQEAIPKGASTASSLIMGAAWGIAAIFAMLFGVIADLFGGNVVPAMSISATLPILAVICSLALPKR